MKVVILSGGFGTRISEYTSIIPKPMIRIGGKPIIEHIMEIYSKHGHKDFYLALGYKSEIIKEYFYNYVISNSDFKINFGSGRTFSKIKTSKNDWCFEHTIEALLSGTTPLTKIWILKAFLRIQNTTSQYNLITFKQFSLEILA